MAEERKTMDEIIKEANLKGDSLKSANDFALFLKDEGMLAGGIHGSITHNNKSICFMHMDGSNEVPGPWTVWPDGEYSEDTSDLTLSDDEKVIVWENINICGECGGKCAPGSTKTIFGKQIDNVCSAPLQFCDPKGETLKCLIKILKAKKKSFN